MFNVKLTFEEKLLNLLQIFDKPYDELESSRWFEKLKIIRCNDDFFFENVPKFETQFEACYLILDKDGTRIEIPFSDRPNDIELRCRFLRNLLKQIDKNSTDTIYEFLTKHIKEIAIVNCLLYNKNGVTVEEAKQATANCNNFDAFTDIMANLNSQANKPFRISANEAPHQNITFNNDIGYLLPNVTPDNFNPNAIRENKIDPKLTTLRTLKWYFARIRYEFGIQPFDIDEALEKLNACIYCFANNRPEEATIKLNEIIKQLCEIFKLTLPETYPEEKLKTLIEKINNLFYRLALLKDNKFQNLQAYLTAENKEQFLDTAVTELYHTNGLARGKEDALKELKKLNGRIQYKEYFYHPALPTVDYDNYEQTISNHVPLLATIPQDQNGKALKIVSWNVMEDAGDSFALLPSLPIKQAEEQKSGRHQRIAASLALFIEKNSPVDFITLQNISCKEQTDCLLNLIQAQLNKKGRWGYTTNKNGVITLYNVDLYANPQNIRVNKDLKGDITTFTSIKGNYSVEILNVNAPYKILPKDHETYVQNFLQPELKTKKVAIGSFNCHIAPIDDTPQNIITATTRNEKHQGAHAIDGAFYLHKAEDVTTIKQPLIQHLNPMSGEVFTQQQLPIKKMPKLSQVEINQFRMVMCVDEHYKINKLADGKTLFERETSLQQEFIDQELLVREARNLNNESMIAVATKNDKLFGLLSDLLKTNEKENESDARRELYKDPGMRVILIPKDKISILSKNIRNIIHNVKSKFDSYLNPTGCTSFFRKWSRTFDEKTVTTMQNRLIGHLERSNIGNAFITIQGYLDYIHNEKLAYAENSSLLKRLVTIKQELSSAYPLPAFIHNQFESYLNPPNPLLAKKLFRTFDKKQVDDFERQIMKALDAKKFCSPAEQAKAVQEAIADIKDKIFLFSKNSSMEKRLDAISKQCQNIISPAEIANPRILGRK